MHEFDTCLGDQGGTEVFVVVIEVHHEDTDIPVMHWRHYIYSQLVYTAFDALQRKRCGNSVKEVVLRPLRRRVIRIVWGNQRRGGQCGRANQAG